MPGVFAIADLHFNTIPNDMFLTLVENWGYSGDAMIVVGDTDTPERLSKWPFHKTQNLVVPGNTDPDQNKVVYRVLGDKITVIGCLGANWPDTPWAHWHMHDQPCDPDPVLEWLEFEVSKAITEEIILALHHPLSYSKDGKDIFHPRFVSLIKSDKRIKHILHGHVHKGCGELPAVCAQARIHLVAADRLGYKPKKIASF